jgi:hypothetical protein
VKQYALINIQKIKTFSELDGRSKHNLRISHSKNVDATRSRNNWEWFANPKLSVKDEVKRLFEKTQQIRSSKGVKKLRSDTVKAVEIVLSASPDFFEGKTLEEIKKYFFAQMDWARVCFEDRGMLLSANIHFDESNPHLHLIFAPLAIKNTNKGKIPTFSARDFVGDKKNMSFIRDWHANLNAHYGLERGEKYFEEGREPKRYTKSIAAKRNLKDREEQQQQPKDEVENQNELQQSINKKAEELANKLGDMGEPRAQRPKRGLSL